jgi:uncharacterized protein involved in response to NO
VTVAGTISAKHWCSRTRRAMSCAYWLPKSTIRSLSWVALTWRLFQLLQLVTVARIGADVVASGCWLAVAAGLWAVCFVPWCARLAPVYCRPRADGRPG